MASVLEIEKIGNRALIKNSGQGIHTIRIIQQGIMISRNQKRRKDSTQFRQEINRDFNTLRCQFHLVME